MASKNKECTRYYSSKQEEYIAKLLNGQVNSNSGAGKFNKSDVVVKNSSMSIECKTCMTDKESFSIKKEWFNKHKNESFSNRLSNNCIAFNFGPNQENYFIINEKLMKFLTLKLQEENDIYGL